MNTHLKAIEDVTGFATVKHLSSKQVLDIQFPVPSVSDQQRVVGVLDEAFEGIATARANDERNLRNARALFEQCQTSLFSSLSERTAEQTLGDVCSLVRGPFGGSLKKSDFVDQGYAVYEQSHAIGGGFTEVRYFVSEEKFKEMRRSL